MYIADDALASQVTVQVAEVAAVDPPAPGRPVSAQDTGYRLFGFRMSRRAYP
jgi:hypothetical protein